MIILTVQALARQVKKHNFQTYNVFSWILLGLFTVILFSRKAIRQGIKTGILAGIETIRFVKTTGSASGRENVSAPQPKENTRNKEIFEKHNSL